MTLTRQQKVIAVIVDRRDDGSASELGTYNTITEAKQAIEEYRRHGSMIACNGPANMIEKWMIYSCYDDELLAHGE